MNELPSSALGVMRQFSVSRPGIDMFSDQLIKSVKSGEVNPLELKSMLKALEAIIERVDKETRENQLTEAQKHFESSFEAFGCKIEKSEVGVKYDYTTSGDPVYNHRLQIFEAAKNQLDERVNFLKAIKEPLTVVDDESGEVVTVRPPVKKSTSGLKFSIK